MVSSSDIQHNRLRGEKPFQTFCLKLVKALWKDQYAQEHGRRGQEQNGVDISGRDYRGGFKSAAVQCKGSESNDPRKLSEADIEDEVEKGKKFTPKLDLLIIAYSGLKDAKLQKKAMELSEANIASGLFRVVLWSWDDIVQQAGAFPEVMESLLVENRVAFAPQLSLQRPKAGNRALIEHLQNALSVAQATTEDAPEITLDDPVAQAKIDVLRDQVRAGNGRNVVQALRDFIATLPNTASSRVRLRAHANLGAALVQCGLFSEAVVAFDNAAEAEPDTADGLAHASKAALFRNQNDKVYELATRALALDSEQKLAATLLIDAAPEAVTAASLEGQVGQLSAEGDVGYSISRRYADEGNFDKAIEAARNIINTSDNWVRNVAIGEAILRRFERDLEARIGAPLSAASENLLEEAKSCLDRAWEIVRSRSDQRNWAFVGAHLSAINRLLGEDDRADDLAIETLGIAPDNRGLMERAALAYLRKGDGPKALELSLAAAETGGVEEALFAASVAASVGEWLHVAPWAQKAFDGTSDSDMKGRSADLLVLAKSKVETPLAALSLADELRSSVGSSITFESRVAELARRSEDPERLDAARNRIGAFDSDAFNPLEKFQLADALADDEQWSKAADLLANLHSLDRSSEILTRRLFALYRANRRTDARDLYQSLREGALASIEIRRLGAAIYERCGMLPEALKELEEAIKLDPANLRSRLDWARLCLRDHNEKAILRWLRNADLGFNAPPIEKMELAQLLDHVGKRNDALRVGYQTLRENWGASERLHMMYMSLFLLRGNKKEAYLKPKVVSADNVVFLENQNGVKKSYRIEDTREVGEDILPPEHAFARELMGASVGDERAAPAGIGQQPVWKIVEIKHKYLDLFHRTIDAHPTLFPGSTKLGSFNVDATRQDGFEPVFEQVRERARYAQEVVALYTEKLIPIDTVATMLGVDVIDASLGLRFKFDVKLDVCIGNAEERESSVLELSQSKRVIVDASTIAVWDSIGLLEFLDGFHEIEVLVVQSTIDALTQRADDAESARKQVGGSFEMVGDKVALIERSKEDLKSSADRWRNLESWTRKRAKIIPTETISGVDEDEVEQILSRSTMHSIATAAANGLPYVCDDRRVRAFGAVSGVKASGWTQAFLVSLLNRGMLTRQQYVKLIANLSRQRMGFVSVGVEDVLACAQDCEDLSVVVRALTGPTVDPRSILEIALETVVRLWANAEWTNDRDRIVSHILHSLLVQRTDDGVKLLRIIVVKSMEAIRAFDFPMSLLAWPWSDYVESFVRGHFLQEVINR